MLGRQVPHPKTKREERLVLTVLQRLRPVHERLSNLFTPDTLRRWDREFVRRKWDGAERIIVLSIWHENRCTASFRLPVQDAGKMIAAIAGRDDSGDQPAKQ